MKHLSVTPFDPRSHIQQLRTYEVYAAPLHSQSVKYFFARVVMMIVIVAVTPVAIVAVNGKVLLLENVIALAKTNHNQNRNHPVY